MEKRIELEKRNRALDQIDELNLDNCRSTTIEGLTDDFVNLRALSLNGVGLTSLKGFPALPNLRKLEMGDNRIAGGLQVLKGCAALAVLTLSNNKIKDLESLEALKDLSSLKSLDLYRNDVTQVEDYRNKVFELLPGLTYLDGTDKSGKEADESDLDDEEGGAPVNGKSGRNDVNNSHKTGNGADDSSPESFTASPDAPDVAANEEVESYESSAESEDGDLGEGEEDDEDGAGEEVSLKDIYREDLDKDSDGGDYEQEEDSEDSDGDVDYDTSRAEEDEGETSAALYEGEEAQGAEDEEEADVEGEEELEETEGTAQRGVKRQHEETEESD